MARSSRDGRSASIDRLRSELENIDEAETLVPARPSSRLVEPVGDGQATDGAAEGRTSLSHARDAGAQHSESGHVRFSEELRSPGRRQHLQPDTDLYPIESRIEDAEAARRRRENREQHAISQAGRHESLEDEDLRVSRVPFAEPPSVTRPRHRRLRFGAIEDSIKRAAQASATVAHAKDWVIRQKARTRRLKQSRSFRLRQKVAEWYKRWILEGFLRQKPLPPSADGRHIPLSPGQSRLKDGFTDERRAKPYISNFIRSSRYTAWSFLPKQLFFQFSKLANTYFLTISILQMIPDLSTTGTYTTFGPLMAFVAISMGKEGWDDYRRYKLDKLENRTEAWVLDPDWTVLSDKREGGFRDRLLRRREDSSREMEEMSEVVKQEDENPPWSKDEEVRWSKIQWQDIRVGDIVRLRRDENLPADIVLLHATGPNGIAYIETMALDGETNLKSKQACPLFAKHCRSPSALKDCEAEVVSEDPNLDLYNYEGKAIVNGEAMPLSMNQVVYRGSTLRNTSEAVGLVINTGEECKIRMNANRNVSAKSPAMQAKVNKIIVLLVCFVVVLSIGCSIGNTVWLHDTRRFAWYLDDNFLSFGKILIGFVIAFNTLIPLSLYVSLEIVKIGQLMLLRDIDMYDPKSNTPMRANTGTILENLGQVSYVFSDKTGTLTENLMRFRKLSVAGTAWLHDMDVDHDQEPERGRQMSGANSRHRKGKQAMRGSIGSSISDCAGYPSMDGRASTSSSPRRSSSDRVSTAQSNRAQPYLKTDALIRYIRQRPNTATSKKARHFILCIALCHTCLPERKANGEIEFQAASPDELALVKAAQDLGMLLIDRPAQSIRLQFTNEHGAITEESYEVLDVIEFSSKRKRMSIIIRLPDRRICIFSKGADSVILSRLRQRRLAMEKASAVDRQASIRKSMEQEKALRKMSVQSTRNSRSLARATSNLSHRTGIFGRKSTGKRSTSRRPQSLATDGITSPTFMREGNTTDAAGDENWAYQSPRRSTSRGRSMELLASPVGMLDPYEGMVDESIAVSDSAVFERCFQHIDDFACEGLRTLLYAYRYVDAADYNQWKRVYHEATTSLVNRQERIEAAAELIEQNLDLAGATAIEDKLQQGVPETIEMLRRANIKVWMLTGDKRETAINIAHSAGICKLVSEIYILDATEEGPLQDRIATTLVDVGRGMVPHCVVVIDGHTLGVVEEDDALKVLFFDLVARVDSVICCRASPAQKATLVKCIRERVPTSLTLAIGDGANDIAMIQSSHVGIGISGREGLQAARVSDYSIAQFRFLQKLLFVHGRWNYIRTGKYVLATFWKEVTFYLVQALYQRYNGFTGTSFYESTSLAVFNTLFTSLAVILLGMFEQDLRAETLLAMPELYTYGQKNRAFNFRKYVGWMIVAVLEAVFIFFGIWGIFSHITFDRDNGLFAMGDLAFTAGVLFINIKLLVLELHNKNVVTFIGFFISVAGWFLWNLFLSAIYTKTPGPYAVRGDFIHNFGKTLTWWLTLLMVLAMVVVFELAVTALRRIYWPQDEDLVQELERFGGAADALDGGTAELGEAQGGDGADELIKQPGCRVPGLSGRVKSWRWPAVPGRRPSKKVSVSGDVYVAPPFAATPADERAVDPVDEAGARGGTKKRGASASVCEVQPEANGEGVGSAASPSHETFVQSPVELSSPIQRRHDS